MNRLISHLGKLFSLQPASTPEELKPAPTVRAVRLAQARHRSTLLAERDAAESQAGEVQAGETDEYDDDSELGFRIEDIGPGKTVLPSRFLLHVKDDSLSLDDSGPEEKEASFDPYNTGSFDRSRSWSKHARK